MTKRKYYNLIIIPVLLIMLLVSSIDLFASDRKIVVDYVSSTLEGENVFGNRRWKCSIVNNLLTAEIYDKDGLDLKGSLWMDGVTYRKAIKTIHDKQVELTLDLNDLTDGLHSFGLSEYVKSDKDDPYNNSRRLLECKLDVKHTGSSVFIVLGGTTEDEFYNSLSKYDPKANDGLPYYAAEMEHLDEIITLAKRLTADCKTDAEKALVIHNWIAKNTAYDWENSTPAGMYISADPDRTFALNRGVCSGFSRLARVMFGAAGVPSLIIQGNLGYARFNDNEMPDWIDHEWNAVYLNGRWMPMDITADCDNSYMGKDSEFNRSGNSPYMSYFCPLPTFFRHTSSLCVIEFADVNGITVSESSIPKYSGDTYQDVLNKVDVLFNYEQSYDKYVKPDRNKLVFTGYDENKSGEQEISVSYGPWKTSFKVYEVKPVEEKKENTLVVTTKAAAVKASAVKKKDQTIKANKVFTISKAQGKVTYKKVSAPKGIYISSKGIITIIKGTKKGTYKLKVAVTAAGNTNYKAKTQKVTVIVKVK